MPSLIHFMQHGGPWIDKDKTDWHNSETKRTFSKVGSTKISSIMTIWNLWQVKQL